MRALLSFVSMLALGLMIAVLLAFIAAGTNHGPAAPQGQAGLGIARLDYPSLLLGLAIGIGMATLGRLSWSELPRRVVTWLLMNEYKFYQVALAAVCLAVLVMW